MQTFAVGPGQHVMTFAAGIGPTGLDICIRNRTTHVHMYNCTLYSIHFHRRYKGEEYYSLLADLEKNSIKMF